MRELNSTEIEQVYGGAFWQGVKDFFFGDGLSFGGGRIGGSIGWKSIGIWFRAIF